MDLTTRCPQCGATFSASLEQLQLRKGYIRCPNCAHIFDGFDAVVPADARAAQATPTPRPAAPVPGPVPDSNTSRVSRVSAPPGPVVRQSPRPPEGGRDTLPHVVRQRVEHTNPRVESRTEASRTEPAFTMTGRRPQAGVSSEPTISLPVNGGARQPRGEEQVPYMPRRPQDEGDEPRADELYADEAHAGDTPSRDNEPFLGQRQPYGVYVEPRTNTPDPEAEPDFLDPLPARYRGPAFYFWGILSVLGVALFLGQCLYVYRAQLAAHLPAVRPLLERACGPLHCRVPYSRDISQITIMNSSLQTRANPQAAQGASSATQPPEAMVLRVTLRNSLDKPQEWPTLVLDLLDFSGTVVVKKDLPPSLYLPPGVAQHPFGARSEVTAMVPITMNGVKVSGFQLTKYFS